MIAEMSNVTGVFWKDFKLKYVKLKQEDPPVELKLMTLDMVDIPLITALAVGVCLLHASISVIHIAELIWTFDSKLLVQYGPVLFGTSYGLVAIVTSLWCKEEARALLKEICATRWPLNRYNDVTTQRIRDESQVAIRRAVLIAVLETFTSLFFWPIFGHENEMYFALTLLDRYVPKAYVKPAAYMYYASFSVLGYCMVGITVILCPHWSTNRKSNEKSDPEQHTCFRDVAISVAYIFMTTYILLHQKFQVYLLQKYFEYMSRWADVDIEENLLSDNRYQATVAMGLQNGIRHHVNMKKWIDMTNDMSFGPVIAFTLSGIVFMTSDIVYIFTDAPKSSYPRTALLALMAFITIVTVVHAGQSLIDESEKLFSIATSTPWPTWNISNRKTLLLFLMMAKEPLALKTSEIIVVNNTFIVRFFRSLMSIFTVTKKCMMMKQN